ncbi:carboxynorspermidine decarboxylase [Deferribacter abyssi]
MKELHKEALTFFPKEITELVETPCYLISEDVIEKNCRIMDSVQKRTGVKILLAQKAYSLPVTYPLISKYLHGVCASGLWEARLGWEEFKKEVHTYAPAFEGNEIDEIIDYSSVVIFNSVFQLRKYGEKVKNRGKHVGLRVNPGYSEVEVDLYNPCIPGSRFGVNPEDLEDIDLEIVDGFHFHALCEQNADVLVRVLNSFEKKYGKYLANLKWVNFGGGHHITRKDYDIELLCDTINLFRDKYNNIDVYLEPGEAVVLYAGVFVTKILDIINNGVNIAIVDSSAETHTPDVLAMPYRPEIIGCGFWGEYKYNYKIGGCSCLAGDFFGEYSFERPLKIGDRLIMLDMALYSFVKNNTFNGVKLPSIVVFNKKEGIKWQKNFSYADFIRKIK